MRKEFAGGKLVRNAAGELPARTLKDLDRLKAAVRMPVTPSEAREYDQFGPEVCWDASGRFVKPPQGPVRRAILAALDRHQDDAIRAVEESHRSL